MSSAQSSPTNTNTTSVANSPSPSTAASTGLNPAEFTKEYLGTQTLDRLKLIKKQCGFRKKTETHAEFVDAIYEWFQKNHGPKPVGETPKTRKPRAKKVDSSQTIQTGSLVDSIRAEVAEDAVGMSAPQTATKEKKPRQPKGKKGEQPELKPITLQRKTNRVLVTLTDQEREDIRKNKEAKTKIYQFLDNIHDQLRGSSVAGEAAMDDIIMFILLAKLDVMIFNGQFNIWDTRTQAEGGQFDNTCALEVLELVNYMKQYQAGLIYLLCHKTDHPLRNNNPDSPDLVRQIGMLLKAHPFSKPFIRDINIFHLDNEHTLKRILYKFDTITHAKGRAARAAQEAAANNFVPSSDTPGTSQVGSQTATPKTGSRTKNTKRQTKNTELEEIDLEALNQMDAIGTIYEYFTNKYKGNQGKDMGQYFTERDLMLMSLHLIDKEDLVELGIAPDSTMGDEFCGTFGFPLKTREYFKKAHGIEFRPENVYGVEYSAKTFTLAATNALLSTNTAGNFKLTHGSSFNTNLESHLDFSVHNVPFGDTMRWTDIIKYAEPYTGHTEILTKEIEVKANVDAVLSAQLVIYKTRKMGILIIKDGKETSSPAFEEFRRTIMNKCCVRKIMKIPSTAFSHTNTKTICIYFTKPLDGSKTGSIQFCQLNDSLDTIHEICQVPREDLEARFCSWNPQDYLVDEHAETMKGKSVCEWKKLGEVAEICCGDIIQKENMNNGEFKIFGGGKTNIGSTNKYNREGNDIIIPRVGDYNVKYSEQKYYLTDNGFAIKSTNNCLETKYLYYMLQYNDLVSRNYLGSGQQVISMTKLNRVEIPVPSLEIQNETIAELDELGADKDALIRYHKNLDNHMKLVVKHTIKENLDTIQWHKLGDVVSFKSGNMLSRKDCVDGEYYVIGGGQSPSCKHNAYNMDANTILCSKSGEYAGFISKYDSPVWASDCFGIIPKTELNNNYLYYYLKNIQEQIYTKQTGGGQPHINERDLKYKEIPVPSLEIQQQMVTRMEQIEARKQLIQAEIKTLDDMMKDTLERSYTSTARLPDFQPSTNSEIHEENPDTIELPEPVKPTQAADTISSSSEDETESETESESDNE